VCKAFPPRGFDSRRRAKKSIKYDIVDADLALELFAAAKEEKKA
jgi:hypothetical protein